jgi:hypothetical protein
MMSTFVSRAPLRTTFVCTFLLALVFAAYTNHVWEDYYITYRSSKNLATGHGLVYNHGDRLHTFTSPLGVLLPAVSYLLTGNSSDTGALWIFRLVSATALAGAAALLVSLLRRPGTPLLVMMLPAILLATDAKSLDFTINGMETAFMLLFLAYALWAHLRPGKQQWFHLGTAWAGLMWTRPDSFIYIGLLAVGFWIFNQPARTGGRRGQQLRLFVQAGLLTTALYGPWLAWAWWYYGTPIPHTIVAKAAQSGGWSGLTRFVHGIWQMPWFIWQGKTAAEATFLPAYYVFPTWPSWIVPFGRVLATVSCLLWLVPRVRLEARVASLAYCLAIGYLSFVPYFPFPWYLPATTLLAFVALTGAVAPLWSSSWRGLRWFAQGSVAILLAGALFLTWGAARQARAQQVYIEDGNRRVIGEWLHEHAQPGDSVFMEPLGYIGFFSGLKTFDWPGMSSREVTVACRLVGTHWGSLIRYLEPTWLVLRAQGEGDLDHISPALAALSYDRVRDFSRTDEVEKLDVPGRGLLKFDSHFVLYHRRNRLRQDADGYEIATPIGSSFRMIENLRMRMVHAPGTMIMPLHNLARTVSIWYGFPDDASTGADATDGATFEIWLVDGKTRTKLHAHELMPTANPEDRGLKKVTLDLPPRRHPLDAFLVFETDPRKNSSKDWTFWSEPEIK